MRIIKEIVKTNFVETANEWINNGAELICVTEPDKTETQPWTFWLVKSMVKE